MTDLCAFHKENINNLVGDRRRPASGIVWVTNREIAVITAYVEYKPDLEVEIS